MTLSKIKFIFFLLLFLGLTSCHDQEKTPESILSKEKMVRVLADVYQLENLLSGMDKGSRQGNEVFNTKYFPELLERHQITKEEYDTSYTWYMYHNEIGLELMKEVKDTLEKRKLYKVLYLPQIDTLFIKE